MLGKLLSVGAGVAGGIVNAGIGAGMNNEIDKRAEDNQQWYDQRYNEDFTQRADAQNMLNRSKEQMQLMNQRSRATSAVTGGSTESQALAKQQSTNLLASTTNNIVTSAEKQKNSIEQQYIGQKNAISDKRLNIMEQQMQNVSNTAGAIMGATEKPGTSITIG